MGTPGNPRAAPVSSGAPRARGPGGGEEEHADQGPTLPTLPDDYEELLAAAKADIPGFREDGPALGFVFDDLPSETRRRASTGFDDEGGVGRKRAFGEAYGDGEDEDDYRPSAGKKVRGGGGPAAGGGQYIASCVRGGVYWGEDEDQCCLVAGMPGWVQRQLCSRAVTHASSYTYRQHRQLPSLAVAVTGGHAC